MKTLQAAIVTLLITGCAGSQAPSNLYEVRDTMNQVGDDIEESARPALEPLSNSIDRGMDRGIGSLGLRGRPPSKYAAK